jgi:hypothetical protein
LPETVEEEEMLSLKEIELIKNLSKNKENEKPSDN